jgi:hypothetical protein
MIHNFILDNVFMGVSVQKRSFNMTVKNILTPGASGNIKPIPIHHAIPPPSSAIYKVTIDNGTTEIDISDRISSGKFNGGTTKTIGNFELSIVDPAKTIYNQIANFNDVYFYGEYGETATTKRLRYKIESKGFNQYETVISGLGIIMTLASKNIIYKTKDVNGNITTKGISTIITEILQANFPEITDFSEIETNATLIEKNYSEIPFMDIINDLCGSTHEFYLDYNLVPHYFTRGSITNSEEAISDEVNFLGTDENADNAEEIFSRVRVYGANVDGVQIIATSEEDTSLTGGIKKDKVIVNTSIKTTLQGQQIADAEFETMRNPSRLGAFNSCLLPSLNPGEKIFIAIPNEGIVPGYYQVEEFTHEFDLSIPNGFKTKVVMEKRRISLSKIIEETNEFKSASTEKDNPNDMDFSQIITFDVDSGTHSGTQISEGYLKVSPGLTTGTWISPIFSLNSNLTAIELKWAGDNLVQDYLTTSAQLWFSLNGGTTWKLNPFEGEIDTVPTGKDLRAKVVLNAADSRVKIVGIYFKY